MRVNINFKFYPDFNNCENGAFSNSIFKVHRPKIELSEKYFLDLIDYIFSKNNTSFDESKTSIDFFQRYNSINLNFYIDVFNEDNKKVLDNILFDLICGIADDFQSEFYYYYDFVNKINVKLEFCDGAIFYNTYKYKCRKGYQYLDLIKSIGEFNHKMIRYNEYLKLKEKKND